MTGLPENAAGPRHPLERLLAPVEPIAVSDPSWPAARTRPPRPSCTAGWGPASRPGCAAGDWRLYARLDGASDGADADEAIASFVAEGGRAARGYRARDGRVVVPFGFAEAYAGYAAELWAEGAAPFGLSPRLLNAFYRLKRAIPRRAQLAARRVLIRRPGRARLSPLALRRQRRRPAPVLRALRPGRRAEAGAALPLVLAARAPARP